MTDSIMHDDTAHRVWLITGASRGFGRILVSAALAAGDQVIATARDPLHVSEAFPEAGDSLLSVALDVTDSTQAEDAVRLAIERFGRIDVVVNNAGYGHFGSIEETPESDVRALFDTNVFGLLTVTRAVLPTLRSQRSGHIINFSSSAGFATSAGRGLYSASKFAVEGITEALHAELAPLGIRVSVIEPGSFRTEFLSTGSRGVTPVTIEDYAPTVGILIDGVQSGDGKQPGDPDKAIAAIVRLIDADEPPLRLTLGSDAVALVEGKLESVRRDLDAWRHVSLSTDFASE